MRARSNTNWQDDEYARLMGSDAFARQQAAAKRETKDPDEMKCDPRNCGWKGPKALMPGHHHSVACPMFTKEDVTL